MNRKLHNTILAFSVTGVMLAVGLVVAEPVLSGHPAPQVAPPVVMADDVRPDEALDAALEARIRQFDADLAGVSQPAEALALTASLVAVTATEVALQSVRGDLHDASIASATTEQARQAEPERPRTTRRNGGSRDVIAVPYFSFARGSRGSRS